MATNKSKSMDKMPARKMPEGFKMELKTTPKATAKATPKATTKPKPKATPLSPSEKAFLAGQKKKAQITKRTGVYPNTAN
jgi:hypothetical protein